MPTTSVTTPRHRTMPSRPRTGVTPMQLARRRMLTRWTKRLLPVAALGVLGIAAFWRILEPHAGPVSIPLAGHAGPSALSVVDPQYRGVDDQNRPYTVTAAQAVQNAPSLIDLDRPRADMLLNGGAAWALLESQAGRFDRTRNHLDLEGAVTVWHDSGITLATEAAAIDLNRQTAAGDRPVAAQGPFGTLNAEGFRLIDRGQVVRFTGRSRLVLEGGA